MVFSYLVWFTVKLNCHFSLKTLSSSTVSNIELAAGTMCWEYTEICTFKQVKLSKQHTHVHS